MLFAIRNGGFSGGIMPANVVVGEDAEAVADFLSKYSGKERHQRPRRAGAGRRARPQGDPRGPRRGARGLRRRGFDVALLDEALELDERRRALLPELEELRRAQERGVEADRRAAAHAARTPPRRSRR